MAKSSSMTIRINPELKSEADAVLNYLGLTTSEAVAIFLRQVVLNKGIPFAIKAPLYNGETLKAMQEAEEIAKNAKGFDDIDDMFRELNS
jgi:DNA-damage-inducible protein J